MAGEGGEPPLELSVQDPWFSQIARGRKTVEGRLCRGKFSGVRPGTVAVVSKSGGRKKLVAVVVSVARYGGFEEYLSREGLNRTLPGVRSIKDGVSVYRRFYSETDEREHGVVALHLERLER